MGFFIFDLLKSVMFAIAELLGLSIRDNVNENGLRIFVKMVNKQGAGSKPSNVPIDVQFEWSISEVKDAIAKKLKVNAEDLKIIFAGHELNNNIKVKECDLGQQSVLHAVQLIHRRSPEPTTSESTEPLNKTINQILDQAGGDSPPDATAADDGPEPPPAGQPGGSSFHVYCASPCGALRRGKLRVRCCSCRQGAFTVSRDPCNWRDVLQPGRVHGTCETAGCRGQFAQFFFKCAEHRSRGEGDEAVPLDLVRNNLRSVPCLACGDTTELVMTFGCAAGHVTCLECFTAYCRSRLDERQFVQDATVGYTLGCPAGCPQSLIAEAHHFRLMGDQQYERYQRFAAEECVLAAGGVLCPRPGCGMGLIPDELCRRVQCQQGCGFVFCRECLEAYHQGECNPSGGSGDCTAGGALAFGVDRAATARWEEATRSTIQVITKPCPKCRTPTERDGGCMHMICPRSQCNFHWCWICQTEWTRECMGNHWFG